MPEWEVYLEKLNQTCDAVKLTAYHTKRTADLVNQTARNAHLTSEYVTESILPVIDYQV